MSMRKKNPFRLWIRVVSLSSTDFRFSAHHLQLLLEGWNALNWCSYNCSMVPLLLSTSRLYLVCNWVVLTWAISPNAGVNVADSIEMCFKIVKAMLNQIRCSHCASRFSWCCSWQSTRNALWVLARDLATGDLVAQVSSILPPSKCSLPIKVKEFKKDPTWQHPKMPWRRMGLGEMMLAEGCAVCLER